MAGTVTTPIFTCGFECQNAAFNSSTLSHWASVQGTPVLDTTIFAPGGGAASLLIDNTATSTAETWNHAIAAGTRQIAGRAKLRIDTDTTGTASLYQFTNASGTMALQLRPGRKLRVAISTAFSVDSAALTLGQWYEIDWLVDSSTGTASFAYWIEGVSQTGTTRVQAAADLTTFTVGNTGTNTYAAHVDDVVLSTTPGDAPIGGGHVVGYTIWQTGTHNTPADFLNQFGAAITNGDGSFTNVDEIPANTTDYIAQPVVGATAYVEYMYSTPGVSEIPRAVAQIVSVFASNTTGGTERAQLYDGTTAADAYASTTINQTTIYNRAKNWTQAPSGVTWTLSLLQHARLRWGFSGTGGATNTPRLSSSILEVEFVDAGVVFPFTATGTGTAQGTSSTVKPTPTIAAGTGMTWQGISGDLVSIGGRATGTGAATAAAGTTIANPAAGLAAGTGAVAVGRGAVKATAGSAAGTGAAYTVTRPTVVVNAGLATGTGTAVDATTTKGLSVAAGAASGTSVAYDPLGHVVAGTQLTVLMGMV